MKKPDLFRSLASRNYRLFFFGQGVSLIGTWMQQVAMSWLVYEMTGSAFALGLVLFCGQAPSLLISPFAGVLIDRWDRARVFIVCQWLAMLHAFVLAGLALSGEITVWQIMALSLFIGIVISFDMVARQALTIRLVEHKQDLANAIALSSAMFNGSRLLGPAIGGLILAASSAGVCFLVNAFSFIAVLISFYMMRLSKPKIARAESNMFGGLKEGVRYIWGEPILSTTIAILAIGSLTSSTHAVLLPVLASDVLGGGPRVMGLLGAAVGIGALGAALLLASRKRAEGVELWVGTGLSLFGVMLGFVGLSTSLPLSLGLFVVFGFGMVAHFAAGNTVLQTVVKEDKRGRVMSFYNMALIGMTPVGSLISGYINDRWGPQAALYTSAFVAMLFGVLFLSWLPRLRGRIKKAVEPVEVVH